MTPDISHALRIRRGLLALLAYLAICPPSQAQTPEEQAYLAARVAANAALKKMEEARNPAVEQEARRLIGELEARLRRIVEPAVPRGFAAPGSYNPALCCWTGAEALDGLVYPRVGDPSGSDRVVVTTEGLAKLWVAEHKDWWENDPTSPADLRAVMQTEDFYSMAIDADARVVPYLALPVHAPAGVDFAVALLAGMSNAGIFPPPEYIAVSVVQRGGIFVAVVEAATKPAPVAACEALQENGQSDRDYREVRNASGKCWADSLKDGPVYSAATQQAQALVDGLAGQ